MKTKKCAGLAGEAGEEDEVLASGKHEGGEDVDGGGLAGAVRAEEAEDGALFDLQVDSVDAERGLGRCYGA